MNANLPLFASKRLRSGWVWLSLSLLILTHAASFAEQKIDFPKPAPSYIGLLGRQPGILDRIPPSALSDVQFCYMAPAAIYIISKTPKGYSACVRLEVRWLGQPDSPPDVAWEEAPIDKDVVVPLVSLWASWLQLSRYTDSPQPGEAAGVEVYAAARSRKGNLYEGMFVSSQEAAFANQIDDIMISFRMLVKCSSDLKGSSSTQPNKLPKEITPEVLRSLVEEHKKKCLEKILKCQKTLDAYLAGAVPRH